MDGASWRGENKLEVVLRGGDLAYIEVRPHHASEKWVENWLAWEQRWRVWASPWWDEESKQRLSQQTKNLNQMLAYKLAKCYSFQFSQESKVVDPCLWTFHLILCIKKHIKSIARASITLISFSIIFCVCIMCNTCTFMKIIVKHSNLTIVLNRTTMTVLVIMIALTRTSVWPDAVNCKGLQGLIQIRAYRLGAQA